MVNKKYFGLAAAVFSVLAVTACGGGTTQGGGSTELTISSPLAENAPASQLVTKWSDRITECTDGKITFKPFYSESLLSTTDTFQGTADGRADLGVSSPQYYPSQLPLTTLSELPFITRDIDARLKAFADLYSNNKDLQSEWNGMGIEPLVFLPTGLNTIFAAKPLTDVEELDGMSIRAIGDTAKVLKASGTNTVSIPFGEVYQALQQGAMKAVSSMSLTIGASAKLQEVAPYVTDIGTGAYTLTVLVAPKDFLDSRSSDDQNCFKQSTTQYYNEVGKFVANNLKETCKSLADDGAKFDVWSDAEIDKLQSNTDGSIQENWIASMEDKGRPGEETLKRYRKILDKHASDFKFGVSVCTDADSQK